jgi:hypothetical protein
VPPDTIVHVDPPPGAPEGAAAPALAGIRSVRNPLAVSGGRDSEVGELACRIMPEAFRALTFRAVRDEDYAEIAERLDWVQKAGAVSRWTGSWLTTFVTPDPLGSYTLSHQRRRQLGRLMDCVRQVGREVYVCDPIFVAIDLEIAICIDPGAYFGQVKESILRALTGPARMGAPLPFFHLDRFTFGDPLIRAELEAAIHDVPGVLMVAEIKVRRRGRTAFQTFADVELEVGDDRILRLRNDPRFPDQGTLKIRLRKDEIA